VTDTPKRRPRTRGPKGEAVYFETDPGTKQWLDEMRSRTGKTLEQLLVGALRHVEASARPDAARAKTRSALSAVLGELATVARQRALTEEEARLMLAIGALASEL